MVFGPSFLLGDTLKNSNSISLNANKNTSCGKVSRKSETMLQIIGATMAFKCHYFKITNDHR